MRVVLGDFISLDRVVQAPGGADEDTDNGFAHGGWSMPFFDPETMGPPMEAAMETTEALLFGRRTWQGMAAVWPDRAGDPFADRINGIPKFVASRTLNEDDLTWSHSTLLPPDDVVGEIARLKQHSGGDLLVWGSAHLARDLVRHDLVDEYRLMIEPVILGGGKRLFPDDTTMRPLELVERRSAPPVCTSAPIGPSDAQGSATAAAEQA